MGVVVASSPTETHRISQELEKINSVFEQLSQNLRSVEQERDALRAEVEGPRTERDQYRKALAAWVMAHTDRGELERRAAEPSRPYKEVLARLEQLKRSSV